MSLEPIDTSTTAELIRIVEKFTSFYGLLWDATNPKGEAGGFLSEESVNKYDDLHEEAARVLERVRAYLAGEVKNVND